jgi:hypothetical protein
MDSKMRDPMNINRMTYDEMSKVVNESYAKTNDVRRTVKDTGVPFDLVFDMTGLKDSFDFYDGED